MPIGGDATYIIANGQGAGPAPNESYEQMLKTILAVTTLLAATPAAALAPLHKNPTVVNGFYNIGLADEVRRNCDQIDARMFRAFSYIKSIERFARDAGYTAEEIDQFVDNKSEKEKLRRESGLIWRKGVRHQKPRKAIALWAVKK